MDRSKLLAFLKDKVPLFSQFPEARLGELVDGSKQTTFEPNEAVIEFGEEGLFLGVLLDGKAEASITDDGGEKHRLASLKPGDIFGEMSLMTGDKTVADIIGITRCAALLVPQTLFSTILITFPPAIKYLSRIISERAKKPGYRDTELLGASALRRSDDPYGLKLKNDHPMKILVVNCGSSSLKYNLFDTVDESLNARGSVERIGGDGMRHVYRSSKGSVERELPRGGHAEAFGAMIQELTGQAAGVIAAPGEIAAVGHRVVHGGDTFAGAAIITDAVVNEIESLTGLAPLHNPVNLTGIREARRVFAGAVHVAVFDTSFHHTLPPYASLYGIPYEYYESKHIHRFGFHGMSHSYVSLKAAQFLKRPYNELEIISCHLGNGASLCAVDHGRSVDTTMGLTPSEGLIMGTRSGDVDPSILIYLMRSEGMGPDELEALINRKSGLLGISGVSNDMREVLQAAQEGQHRPLLASKTYCYRIRKYIGAYMAAMGGLDALIFTGGVGQGSAGVRSLACQGLGFMGITIDEKKNAGARGFDEITDVAADDSPVKILVVPTDEERMIARETLRTLSSDYITRIIEQQRSTPVPIEVSAHHVHLSQEHVEALFGPGHTLTPQSELSQPGQFACVEQVTLVGPKGRVERVRVLGPARKATQVEIAMTEQFKLGIHPPIRESGDIEQSPGMTLEGPAGAVTIDKGVICALRHIHMATEDALRFGLRDKYRVRVRVSGARELIFGDVLIRVHPSFKLAMHIDTDEGNAANITTGMQGFVDGIQSRS